MHSHATIQPKHLAAFVQALRQEERSSGTICKYRRDVEAFAAFLEGRAVSKEGAAAWREHLVAQGYAPATVNAMVAAVNKFFAHQGWEDCRVRPLRLQRKLFREEGRELTRAEYGRLVDTARDLGRERLALLIESICATGIRVSEVPYLTAEAARQGQTSIHLKGKVRTILLPGKLCRKLLAYAGSQGISSGQIFRTSRGTPMTRKQIWREMKSLCGQARVSPAKVFPHNLRHLFARTFYRATRDVSQLADVLGHSSIETTRIYLISSGSEHARALEQLRLVK